MPVGGPRKRLKLPSVLRLEDQPGQPLATHPALDDALPGFLAAGARVDDADLDRSRLNPSRPSHLPRARGVDTDQLGTEFSGVDPCGRDRGLAAAFDHAVRRARAYWSCGMIACLEA